MTEEAAIESPCIRECRVDQVTGYCAGCFRTLREISYWETYTPAEQRRVMTLIETRRASVAEPYSATDSSTSTPVRSKEQDSAKRGKQKASDGVLDP